MDQLEVQGEYLCLICGYGESCKEGGIAEIYDFSLDITEDEIPKLVCQHLEKQISYNIINKLQEMEKELAKKV